MQGAPCAGKASVAQYEYMMLEPAAPQILSDVFLQTGFLGTADDSFSSAIHLRA
jgi:hypothetical protein